MDDKIKDIFGSLNEQDLAVAEQGKEQIWSRIENEQQKKKRKPWWLFLLLLGGLLFTAGWFLSPGHVSEIAPKMQEKNSEQTSPDPSLQRALLEANSFASSQQKTLDSLQLLNASLSDRLLAMSSSSNPNPNVSTKLNLKQSIIRDTIYMTEVRVEQRIIEKIIRDTIILEVPVTETMEAIADVSGNIPEDVLDEKPTEKISNTLPSSVQFNFSETNLIDK